MIEQIPFLIAFTCFNESAFCGNFPAAILGGCVTKPVNLWDLGRVLFQGDEGTTNMADDKGDTSSLKNLLESVYEVHRKDIKTYTSGHLNPSKLLKPPEARHKRWETADKPPIRCLYS